MASIIDKKRKLPGDIAYFDTAPTAEGDVGIPHEQLSNLAFAALSQCFKDEPIADNSMRASLQRQGGVVVMDFLNATERNPKKIDLTYINDGACLQMHIDPVSVKPMEPKPVHPAHKKVLQAPVLSENKGPVLYIAAYGDPAYPGNYNSMYYLKALVDNFLNEDVSDVMSPSARRKMQVQNNTSDVAPSTPKPAKPENPPTETLVRRLRKAGADVTEKETNAARRVFERDLDGPDM